MFCCLKKNQKIYCPAPASLFYCPPLDSWYFRAVQPTSHFQRLVKFQQNSVLIVLLQAVKLDIPVDTDTTADAITEKLLAKVPEVEKQ